MAKKELERLLRFVRRVARYKTESELDDGGKCLENDDAVDRYNEFILAAREALQERPRKARKA